MSIEYTFEVVKVDEAARCMEVVYSAEGHKTMHVGTRLPFEGESLEDVIKAFEPVSLWVELSRPVQIPTVGARGVVVPTPYIESSGPLFEQESISQFEARNAE